MPRFAAGPRLCQLDFSLQQQRPAASRTCAPGPSSFRSPTAAVLMPEQGLLAAMLTSLPDGAFEAVLLNLGINDLAALSASSRALRSSVACVSEAVWSAVARQDPGMHPAQTAAPALQCTVRAPLPAGYPPEDPVHRAACVLDALRLRAAVHANIVHSRFQQRELRLPAGLACVDKRQHAGEASREAKLVLLEPAVHDVGVHSRTQAQGLQDTGCSVHGVLRRIPCKPAVVSDDRSAAAAACARCVPGSRRATQLQTASGTRATEARSALQDPESGPRSLRPRLRSTASIALSGRLVSIRGQPALQAGRCSGPSMAGTEDSQAWNRQRDLYL